MVLCFLGQLIVLVKLVLKIWKRCFQQRRVTSSPLSMLKRNEDQEKRNAESRRVIAKDSRVNMKSSRIITKSSRIIASV